MITGNSGTNNVFINKVLLDPTPSQMLYNHSPDGFAWGYGGSGPSQLALALLLHFTDKDFAQRHYQHFKADIIAKLPQTSFEIEEATVTDWTKTHGWGTRLEQSRAIPAGYPTNRQKIMALALHDSTVMTVIRLADYQGLDWESTLELLVLQLAGSKKRLEDMNLDLVNTSTRPIVLKLPKGAEPI